MKLTTTDYVVLAVCNFPIYILIGKVIFKDRDDFWEAVRFWFTPNFISFFRGEYWRDRFAEMKLGFFILCCVGVNLGMIFYFPTLLE